MSYNKFPWTNTHGFNLDWIIETVKSTVTTVDVLSQEIDDISNTYETINNITTKRKLSPSGDFTGTWDGESKTSMELKIDDSYALSMAIMDAINAREAIGLIYDGGLIPFGEPIDRVIDGGAI